MAVKEHTDERGYVPRAELPDRNAEKSISLTVADGAITISAKPAGVSATEVSASYTKGIPEIHVPVEKSMSPHRVPISYHDNK
jgi:HSP20 family molecular chaperone IbpA